MTVEEKSQTPSSGEAGAAGQPGPTTAPSDASTKQEPKFEVRDGAYFVDGRKMVKESDLIAAKQSLESALEKAQATHNEAMDSARLELSDAQKQVADLNAKLSEAKEAQTQGATTSEEVARIRQERDEALSKVETLSTDANKALELRRALLLTQYPGLTAESLAEKDMKSLDSLEEALKAVTASRGGGLGNYAVGAGGTGTTQLSDEERAKQVIAATPVRGVRNPSE